MNPSIRAVHAPALALFLGYGLYWLELTWVPGPRTPLAPALVTLALVSFAIEHAFWRLRHSILRPSWFLAAALLGLGILALALFASVMPPHLGQEGDALNYHYSLPRQHLIRGSFAHLSWSTADLWLLPIQTAMAPFWFATALPNKIPQFLVLLGLVAAIIRLAWQLWPDEEQAPWVAATALLGSHAFGIQFGTAMIDIAICYLFVATLSALGDGLYWLAGLEFALYAVSKPFMPAQALSVLAFAAALVLSTRGASVTLISGFREAPLRVSRSAAARVVSAFLLGVVVFALPFARKSLHVAGTPFYPFGAGAAGPVTGDLAELARGQLSTRNAYGEGRTAAAFIKHFWRVAVPAAGVNNAFDYPLGLPYLLFLAPFLWTLSRAFRERRIPILPVLILLLWSVWWAGSQQSRWLYVPLCLLFATCSGLPSLAQSGVLRILLTFALVLTALSVSRAHWPDFQAWPRSILRPQDVALIERCRGKSDNRPLLALNKEIAFAPCAVDVEGADSYWVINRADGPRR